jgi:hypothetical protein
MQHFRQHRRWRNDAAEDHRKKIRLSNQDQVGISGDGSLFS